MQNVIPNPKIMLGKNGRDWVIGNAFQDALADIVVGDPANRWIIYNPSVARLGCHNKSLRLCLTNRHK